MIKYHKFHREKWLLSANCDIVYFSKNPELLEETPLEYFSNDHIRFADIVIIVPRSYINEKLILTGIQIMPEHVTNHSYWDVVKARDGKGYVCPASLFSDKDLALVLLKYDHDLLYV